MNKVFALLLSTVLCTSPLYAMDDSIQENFKATFTTPQQLFDNAYSDSAVTRMSTHWISCEQLSSLHLVFSRYPSIREVVVATPGVTEEQLLNFTQHPGAQKLTYFSIGNGRDTGVTEKVVQSLSALSNLRHLSLNGWNVTDTQAQHVAALKKLTSLDLGYTRVSDQGVAHIKSLTDLTALSLAETSITNRALEHVASLTNLQKLIMNLTPITDEGLKHLKALTQLRELSVSETQITDEGLKHLSDFCWLTALRLDHNTKITDQGLTYLQNFELLKYLSIYDTSATQQSRTS